ncbi:hypothetical protein CAPTEDRAFT_64084, partial [Capitella teleta]
TALVVLFILFTTAGNLLTICVIVKSKRLRSISNIYLASLACADMVVGSFVMIFMLLFTVSHDNIWVFGDALCRIWTFVDFTCCSASLTNVCLIARDRYRTVSQPLKSIRKRTKKGAMYRILLAWAIPLIFWATAISLLAVADDSPNSNSCEVKWNPTFIVLIATLAMMYLPIAAILVLFGAMMTFLHNHMTSMNFDLQRTESVRRQQSFASVMSEDATSEKSGGISFNPKCSIEATHPAERQNSVEKSRLKQQVSAAKTLGIIMGFLLLCWIPYSILCPLKAYWPDAIPRSAYQASIWVNYMNSAINPIIYCLCNPQFRHAYAQLL